VGDFRVGAARDRRSSVAGKSLSAEGHMVGGGLGQGSRRKEEKIKESNKAYSQKKRRATKRWSKCFNHHLNPCDGARQI
jgi:hypothetical protein